MTLNVDLISLSFTLFLLMDPIGNIPVFLSVLKHLEPKRKKIIIIREHLIALGIILGFYFVGDLILHFLQVQQYSVQISGGILLFIIALRMVFPTLQGALKPPSKEEDPLIVPLAVPLVAGPAVLAAMIFYAHESIPVKIVTSSVLIAWISSFVILMLSTHIQKILGEKGIAACERLMGLLLTLIAIQMMLQGLHIFVSQCPQ